MTYQLPTLYQQFIFTSRYARWIRDENRRENFDETVARYFDFFENDKFDLPQVTQARKKIEPVMLKADVLPSMRCLMTAGKALLRDNICGYNCAYTQIDHPRIFSEILYILMHGTGVGYSVERQFVSKMPDIPAELKPVKEVVLVADSKTGWAEAVNRVIKKLYKGQIVKWDVRKLRPKGAPLKTMGGRSSGPQPLIDLLNFIVQTFEQAKGRKLSSIECHDIACKIGECVVVGGVRRSAMLSLSNLSDQRMRDAKSGDWWTVAPHRALANNSVAYMEKPDMGQFIDEWRSLYKSKSGERGFFYRGAATLQAGRSGRRIIETEDGIQIFFGTNPCSEILLRHKEFCNLTEIVARRGDTLEDLMLKIEYATILGTWQSDLTDFNYLSPEWTLNCEEERLLGVSITGIMDNPLLNGSKGVKKTAEVYNELRKVAIRTNKRWAKILGIKESVAITCVKPSGTASQLANCSSGIHSRYAPYYIRRVRQDVKDPLTQFMIDSGIPHESCAMKPEQTMVFSFPIKSPDGAITRNDRTALEELGHWKLVQDNYCEHKPSVTINVREHEWLQVGSWCYDNFDSLSGLSFLPHDSGSYTQAPLEEITEKQYLAMEKKMPTNIDWSLLSKYEEEDRTTASKEFSCHGGACEIG